MRYILLLVLLTASTAQAQSSATTSAGITATVTNALSIQVDQDLHFGDVAQNSTNTVAVTSSSASTFTITGEPGKNVTFTLTDPPELTDMSGNGLSFASNVRFDEDNTPSTSSPLTNSDTITLDGTSGKAYVFLGGTVTATSSQALSTYTGTFTIQVDY